MTDSLEVCLLAAGIGSRMHSDRPKVLQTLAARPLLAHLLDTAAHLSPGRIHVIVGQGANEVKAAFAGRTDVHWVLQRERLGTGHAMQQAAPHLSPGARVLMLLGDAPLIRPDTLKQLISMQSDLALLTTVMAEPFNYGRVIRDGDRILRIVEEKDADPEQRRITEVNTGVMAADGDRLKGWLELLRNDNAQREYLLTDIVEHAVAGGAQVVACKVDDPIEVTGVNTFSQLAALERAWQHRTAAELMAQGVQVMDPARLDVRGRVTAGRNVRVDVNVILEGEVTLGRDVVIGPNCIIKDSRLGDGVIVKANTIIEAATLGANCSVGPFARLRPGAALADGVLIGNFVEVKKSSLGRGSKASHLAYLGDATIGEGVNVGAGMITCNYDGANKFETHIGDGAFIGSNTSLVAPVTIGAGATIGAGSTITKDVDADALALGRCKQRSVTGWQRPTKK